MAEDKKAFLQGKMNQDIDDRILPSGEYRSAQNIQVATSEESDVGAIQNVLGNKKVSSSVGGGGSQTFIATEFSQVGAGTAQFTLTLSPLPTTNQAAVFVNDVQIQTVFNNSGVDLFNIPPGLNFFEIQGNIIRVYGTINPGDVIEVRSSIGLETIGCFFDEKNSKIYYFVTNYSCQDFEKKGLLGDVDGPTTATQADNNSGNLFCGIYLYDKNLDQTTLLVSGLFLNFSKTHTITGVNLIEDLLFFTDNFNQPRKINVKKAKNNNANSVNPYYKTEDKISVAKFAPFMPPLLLDYETTTFNNSTQQTTTDEFGSVSNVEPTPSMETNISFPDDLIDEKFVRFSYRYRFVDGEYSTIAPFTQVCFIPKTSSLTASHMQKMLKRGEVYFQDENGKADGMVNSVNSVNLNIILPSKNITTDFDINAIEILYKESNNNLVRSVELVEVENEKSKDLATSSNSSVFQQNEGVFQYKYKSTLPYKTLPPNQLPRVYDNVPLAAKSQEIIGNRVVYGNFVQDRKLPSEKGITGINFNTGLDVKYDITNVFGNADFNNYYLHKEYPFHSIKSKRTYEVGVVLSDKFGRQSPVLTSTIGDGSITISGKDDTFNSSNWSFNSESQLIQNTSPGNENYCGDALNITFNRAINNVYAKGTFVPINQGLESTYQFQLFKANFGTEILLTDGSPASTTTGIMINNLYFYDEFSSTQGVVGDFFYTSPSLAESSIVTGYSALYLNTGATNLTNNTYVINKFNLNPATGEILSHDYEEQSFLGFVDNIIPVNQPVLVANQNDEFYSHSGQTVTPLQDAQLNAPVLLGPNVYLLTISDFTQLDVFEVGDYLKGQDIDFVKILFVEIVDNNLNIYTEGPSSLSYKNYTGDLSLPIFIEQDVKKYSFFKYKIVPHGWYSYRVVVKQVEQDYQNVYAPGVFDFESKTYVPILADNINKVTRDVEFSNTQEVGLSTSKDKLFPKVVPGSNAGVSVQSNNDILDVVSIGTSKEQGIKNDNNQVLSFVSEEEKNPLMAQIPFGGKTGSNIGSDTATGLIGTTFAVSGSNSDSVLKSSGKRLELPNAGSNPTLAANFTIGDYLKGQNQDLTKIIKVVDDSNAVKITCEKAISEIYKDLNNGNTFPGVFKNKYGLQDNLAVFETKPVESTLDIYYETSTAGLIHELNEALLVPSDIESVELETNFSEDVLFYDAQGNFQNQYAAVVNFIDSLDNNVTSLDVLQVTINSITATNQFDLDTTSSVQGQAGVILSVNEVFSGSDTDIPFEIVFVDNEWRIKPFDNFFFSAAHAPNSFEFNINITHQQTPTQEVNVENILFTLNLENVAPIVESTIDINSTTPVGSFSTQTEPDSFGEIIGNINAKNGSADTDNNELGLIFLSPQTNLSAISSGETTTLTTEPLAQDYMRTNTSGLVTQEATGTNTAAVVTPGIDIEVPTTSLIYDTNGEIIKELELDIETGEIKIRSMFFLGVLFKTFDIDVYDSEILQFNTDEYIEDDQGLFLGKKSNTTVTVTVTADLIVINGHRSGPRQGVLSIAFGSNQNPIPNPIPHGEFTNSIHPYWVPQNTNRLNGVHIWTQDQARGFDQDHFNGYWSESNLVDEQEGMPADLRRPQSNNLYMFGFSCYHGFFQMCWSIEIDQITQEPRINVWSETGRRISSTSSFYWTNHILQSGPARTRESNSNPSGLSHVGNITVNRNTDSGGTVSLSEAELTNADIMGDNNTGIARSTNQDIRDKLANGTTQFDPDQDGFGPFGGRNFFSNRRGAFAYYDDQGNMTGAVGDPSDAGAGRPGYMFQTNQTVTIAGFEYFVAFDMDYRNQNGNVNNRYTRFWCPKVFLCRKKTI